MSHVTAGCAHARRGTGFLPYCFLHQLEQVYHDFCSEFVKLLTLIRGAWRKESEFSVKDEVIIPSKAAVAIIKFSHLC